MAKESKVTSLRAQAPAGFVNVTAEHPQYKPEIANGLPAQGRLLSRVNMPAAMVDGKLKPWAALIFEATIPVPATTRDGELVTVAVGEKFMVGECKALEGLAAFDAPDVIYEVWMLAGEKRKIPGTAKTFVPWEVQINPITTKRLAPQLILRAPAPQLIAPNGTAVAGAGAVALSDN